MRDFDLSQRVPDREWLFSFCADRAHVVGSIPGDWTACQRDDLLPKDPRLPTSGVSTTPRLEGARWYGREGSLPIVVVDTSTFLDLGIEAHVVKDLIRPEYITHPEDEEVILTYSGCLALPKACIIQVIPGTV